MYPYSDRFSVPTELDAPILYSHLIAVNSEILEVYSIFIAKICYEIDKKTIPFIYTDGIHSDRSDIYSAVVVFQMDHNYSHDPSPAVYIEYNKKYISTMGSKYDYNVVVDVSGSLDSSAFEIDMNRDDQEVEKQLSDAWEQIKEFLLMDESIQIMRQKIIEFR